MEGSDGSERPAARKKVIKLRDDKRWAEATVRRLEAPGHPIWTARDHGDWQRATLILSGAWDG